MVKKGQCSSLLVSDITTWIINGPLLSEEQSQKVAI